MKDYFSRIISGSKLWEKIYWGIIRSIQLGSIIYFLIKGNGQFALQAAGNLVGMFSWEIMLAFPKKSALRNAPSYMNDVLIIGFFAASFGGVTMDFYYSIPGYDSIMHILGGGAFVWLGYEYCTLIQIKEKKQCPVGIILLCALGFSMIISNAWELFEFTFDQYFGGDSQHWSLELAQQAESGVEFGIFDPHDPMRFAVIDTMTDMVCNVVGAAVIYIALKIYPYRHRGEKDINKQFETVKKD